MSGLLETLRRQFDLGWRLAEHHLPNLTDAACLWAPSPQSWTVRRGSDGCWRPDWAGVEPEPPPPVTIGWLSWHLIWWWSGALDAIEGRTPTPRELLYWPGSANGVREQLDSLANGWRCALDELDAPALERPLAFPWPEPRPLRLMLAWANMELMKNVAEIGVVRHLWAASWPAEAQPLP